VRISRTRQKKSGPEEFRADFKDLLTEFFPLNAPGVGAADGRIGDATPAETFLIAGATRSA